MDLYSLRRHQPKAGAEHPDADIGPLRDLSRRTLGRGG